MKSSFSVANAGAAARASAATAVASVKRDVMAFSSG
jgi:hypothetical protein